MRPRRIALCVGVWSSRENHYAWTFTKKRLLQDQERPSLEDQLLIVHVNKPRDPSQWRAGGPALPDVTSALQELRNNCSVVELEGDPVAELVKFAQDRDINIMILGSKGRSRVKRTVAKGTTVRVVQQAPCACIVVGPKLSSGEHFRIQAARQPEGVEPTLQFGRRVAIVLNAGPYDPNMVQYTARNVLLAGDRVVLVRCMSKELKLKRGSKQQPEQERDNVREIGRTKLRGTQGVAMAVEVLKGGLKMICNFVESKGIDLVVMAREQRLVRRSLSGIGSGPPPLSALYHRSPCPCMIVPMECLQHNWSSSSRSSVASAGQQEPLRSTSQSRLNAISRQVTSPFASRLRGLGTRHGSLKVAFAAKPPPQVQPAHTSATIDNAMIGQPSADSTQSVLEVIRNEEIELEAIEELDLDQATDLGMQDSLSPRCIGPALSGEAEPEEDVPRRPGPDRKNWSKASSHSMPIPAPTRSAFQGASGPLITGSPPSRRRAARRLDTSRSEGSLDFNVDPGTLTEVVNSLKQQLAKKDEEILLLKEQINKMKDTSMPEH
ncbi:unnamed protein product [Ostreobium quekettii]|uniref:UspA domain-containing protein n=1 Tax=Ostreobium quekettii TaxID=121088 RepID=A0A8S1J4H0_9CHLO|nr:unnamed protein product [Ostreobium quekettii]|eukprot:evm.model.scf_510.5 EVM.evm.TU.scf_510.5   scf_510:62220-68950(-)